MKKINLLKNEINGENEKMTVFMKTCFKSVLCAFIVCSLISMVSFDAQSKEISDEVFRLHILANSDSEEDQNLKLEVRDAVQKYCYNIYGNAETKQEAEQVISENLDDIISTAQDVVDNRGFDYKVDGEIVNMYFTNRVYEDITLPAGYYDAVRITIGSGEGHNWWCVMFPPICISTSENTAEISDVLNEEQTELVTDGSYQYKFKIYELYQNLVNKLTEE